MRKDENTMFDGDLTDKVGDTTLKFRCAICKKLVQLPDYTKPYICSECRLNPPKLIKFFLEHSLETGKKR